MEAGCGEEGTSLLGYLTPSSQAGTAELKYLSLSQKKVWRRSLMSAATVIGERPPDQTFLFLQAQFAGLATTRGIGYTMFP
jgi:hypothetical protein